jgi:tyrosyl-tRNA synthetase
MKAGANPKEFKMALAKEIVRLYHGDANSALAEAEFTKVFSDKQLPTDIPEVTVGEGSLLADVLMENGLVESKSELRRLIEQKGVMMNDVAVEAIDAKVGEGLTPEALAQGVVVKVGKRKFLRIVLRAGLGNFLC